MHTGSTLPGCAREDTDGRLLLVFAEAAHADTLTQLLHTRTRLHMLTRLTTSMRMMLASPPDSALEGDIVVVQLKPKRDWEVLEKDAAAAGVQHRQWIPANAGPQFPEPPDTEEVGEAE